MILFRYICDFNRLSFFMEQSSDCECILAAIPVCHAKVKLASLPKATQTLEMHLDHSSSHGVVFTMLDLQWQA